MATMSLSPPPTPENPLVDALGPHIRGSGPFAAMMRSVINKGPGSRL
jgi:hypothetical protein